MSASETVAPNVSQHAGYVEPSEAFVAHHSGDAAPADDAEAAKENVAQPSAPKRTGTFEEKVGKDEVKVTATPITKGALGYKAPGFVNQLRFKKHYFWLGDEPVPAQDLNQYLRGEKPDVAQPVAAWSSQTGKGLLYFSKDESSKRTPFGVLNLADASEVAKEGNENFSFKIGGHKHTFQAKDKDERNGFVVAVEQEARQAADSNDTIRNSENYKESLKQLEKPGGLAAGAAAGATAAAVSNGHKEDETPRQKSTSSDEEKKAKSRSQSRNKRSSIFGMFDKKDTKKEEKVEEKAEEKEVKAEAKAEKNEAKQEEKAEKKEAKQEEKAEKTAAAEAKKEENAEEKAEKKEAKEEKKEEKAEEKAAKKDHTHKGEAVGAAAAAAGTAGAATAAATTTEEHKTDKANDDKKVGSRATERSSSRSNKRRSIFSGIFEKAKSPTSEKKESDVVPAESSKAKDTPKEAWSLPTKHDNVLKPNSAAEAKALSHVFKDDPTEPASDKENVAKNVTATSATPAATTSGASGRPAASDKRRSFFGSMKKDRKTDESEASAEGESPKQKQSTPSKLGDLFRRPSKAAGKSTEKKEEKKPANAPAPLPEAAESTEAAKSSAAPTGVDGAADEKSKLENEAAKENESKPNGSTIGDVVPEAVTVGQAQMTSGTSPAQVSTAA